MADFRLNANAANTPARIPGAAPAANPDQPGAIGADTPLLADNNSALAGDDWATAGDADLDNQGLDFDLTAGLAAMQQVPLGTLAQPAPAPANSQPAPAQAAQAAPAADRAARAYDMAAQAHLAAARADMAIGDTTSAAPLTANNTFSSVGDPHETTGDGLKFDNQKTGSFTLLQSASGDLEVQNYQDKDAKGRWANATLNKAVAVKDGSDVVSFDSRTGKLTLNGRPADLPTADRPVLLPGGGRVEKTADGFKVVTRKQDEIDVHQRDGYLDITGKLGPQRTDGEVRGGLGAFEADGDQRNDFKARTGDGVMGDPKDPAVVDKFEEEWRVRDGQSLFPAGTTQPGGGTAQAPGDDKPRLTERQAIANDLKDFDKLDRNRDGNLTGQRTYAKVKQYDANQDGKVTREEFLAGRARERADARFKELDKDGDGKLAGNELKERFKRYDTNGDGVVDAREFRHGRLQDTHPLRDAAEFDRLDRSKDGFLTGERTYKKFKRYDENQDGKVSKEEFLKGREAERAARAEDRRRFEELDRNQDGVLSGPQTYAEVQQYDADGDGVVSREEYLKGRAKERREDG